MGLQKLFIDHIHYNNSLTKEVIVLIEHLHFSAIFIFGNSIRKRGLLKYWHLSLGKTIKLYIHQTYCSKNACCVLSNVQ